MGFRISEGRGGALELEFRRHGGILVIGIPREWGDNCDWNSEGMGGYLRLEFQRNGGILGIVILKAWGILAIGIPREWGFKAGIHLSALLKRLSTNTGWMP